MNLELTPRIMGNPSQMMARTTKDVVNFIAWNSGHAPVFAAHNAYPRYTRDVVPEPISVLYECTPYDFDGDFNKSKEEAIRLVNRCEEEGVPTRIRFSGGHGFHVYRVWKPVLISLRKDDQKMRLKDIIRAVQVRDVHDLNLTTMDGRIISDYRRLMRVPNTRWARERKTAAGHDTILGDTYCISLTPDELRRWSTKHIIEEATHPRNFKYQHPPAKLTILEYIKQYDIDLDKYMGIMGSIEGTYAHIRDVPNELVKKYIYKPCIQMDLFNNNPVHMTRMAAVVGLQQLGFDVLFAIDFIKDIAEKAGWVDRFNDGVTDYQCRHIYSKRYKIPKCSTLKQNGLCIGKTCPLYFETD